MNSILFTPEGKLLSSSWDKTIKVWDPELDPEVRQVVGPSPILASPALLTRDGQLLAYSESRTVSMLTRPVSLITLVECAVDRRPALSSGGLLTALIPTLSALGAQRIDHSLAGNAGGTIALACSADGRRLASGGKTGELKTWDLTKLVELAAYRGHQGTISALAISPDGRRVASAHEPPEISRARFGEAQFPASPIPVAVKVWDAESGQEQLTLGGHVNGVYQLAFSADGCWLASASGEQVTIWDSASGKVLRELNRSEFLSGSGDALAFSASGNLLATAGNQVVQLWDTASGHSMAVCRGHQPGKLAIAISPDQARVASATGQQVKIWEAESGLEILSLPLPRINTQERPGQVVALAWSVDGQRLRAALSNASVVEWDATPPAER